MSALDKMAAIGRPAGGVAHDFNNLLTVIIGNAEYALAQLERRDPLREMLDDILMAAKRAGELTRQLQAECAAGASGREAAHSA